MDYREWTEGLGEDREWIIQKTQNEIMRTIHEISSEYYAFPLQLRYDNFLIIVNSLTPEQISQMVKDINDQIPLRVSTCLGSGNTPLEAQQNASRCIPNDHGDNYNYHDDHVTALHFDINHNTERLRKISIYESFIEIMDVYSLLIKFLYSIGGITQYLGGDNFLGFVSDNVIYKVTEKIDSLEGLKVGIGISKNARNAIKLATSALDDIRKDRSEKWKIKKE